MERTGLQHYVSYVMDSDSLSRLRPKSLSQSMGQDPELCLYSGIHLDIRLQTPSPELGSPRRGGVCKLGSSYAGSGSRFSILDKKFSEAFRRFHLLASATRAGSGLQYLSREVADTQPSGPSDYWSTHLSSGTTTTVPHVEFINPLCDGSSWFHISC